MEAVAEIRRALDNSVPLIGFSGSPYTLACYMVEGRVRRFPPYQDDALQRPGPAAPHPGGDSRVGAPGINAQIDSGAQAVMIFDTWGGSLSAAAYEEFSLQYMRRIVAGLKREKDGQRIPSIVFTKNGGLWLEKIAAIGCDAVGLDWTIDLGEARRRVGDKVALQGNLDPDVVGFAAPNRCR